MFLKSFRACVKLAALAAVLGACQQLTYKYPIDQGHRLEMGQMEQIQKGMTRAQVLSILGDPLLQDMFHANRWDYPIQKEIGKLPTQTLSIEFEGDYVVRVIRS
jgi:outer membrane protein assembly factor BamE